MKQPPRRAWLPFLPEDVPAECDTPARLARFELETACALLGRPVPELREDATMGEGFLIGDNSLCGGSTGLLYGAYAYIQALAAGEAPPAGKRRALFDS